ncbi:S-layer homology domain-containing protein [Floridanema aerugineum]|uniref:S-layer homology domain-containing protein n=1 Tax=Floridaenema aerugineum BLCC-F46 TaxID=3153654 RepID=A0ABV4X5B8_9CYAN
MSDRWHLPLMSAVLAVLTAFSGFMAFLGKPEQVTAQQTEQNFPDVPPSYWAYPFIHNLAERGIIAGYPDGRFRPEQPIDRDEFAAIIRQSFNQEKIRNIPSGSAFNDVPRNYWATQPIEEAYEMGFMGAFDGFRFRPQNEISRAQALASIAKGLNLDYDRSTSSSSTNRAITAKNPLVFPLATTALMQPLLPIISQRQQPRPNNVVGAKTAAKIPAQRYLNLYYDDANQVPQSLVNPVAATTQANVVVNYPQPRLLNPNQPLKRSTAAAMIYRALVYQGKLQPLSNNTQATKYYPKPVKNVTTPAK